MHITTYGVLLRNNINHSSSSWDWSQIEWSGMSLDVSEQPPRLFIKWFYPMMYYCYRSNLNVLQISLCLLRRFAPFRFRWWVVTIRCRSLVRARIRSTSNNARTSVECWLNNTGRKRREKSFYIKSWCVHLRTLHQSIGMIYRYCLVQAAINPLYRIFLSFTSAPCRT